MTEENTVTDWQALGLDDTAARVLTDALASQLPADQLWQQLRTEVLQQEWPFAVHLAVYEQLFADWPATNPPPPAWVPDDSQQTNLARLMQRTGKPDYAALHAWSVTEQDRFWEVAIDELGIVFEQAPEAISKTDDVRFPQWLPGASMNIAASCFNHDPESVAVVWQHPGQESQQITRRDLQRLTNRVSNGLAAMGFQSGEAIGIAMPMTMESVAIYLGIVQFGGIVVSISDSFSPEEIATRLRIAEARGIFTQEMRVQTHRPEQLYSRVIAAKAPRAIVLTAAGTPAEIKRPDDLTWQEFLSDEETFAPVCVAADTTCNILFSSGTTGDPKAIPWTHTTPIRAAADGMFHHDIQPGDVVCWPTNLGWMMGPWLVFAALINGACIALYGGPPSSRGFAKFAEEAGVTMLGLVPSLVKSWRITRCCEAADWSAIRAFSSTGECSNAEDMLYLMYLAGYKPVIEYCGGTEIGGSYITGTVVQPASPATFSTPALGHDFVILDEANQPTDNGELFLLPPSLGLSTLLLNHDHIAVYHEGVPCGPNGEVLRRHGDQVERLPGGYYRSHGRADDTMNLKGVKVSSAELERTCNQVEGIRETAAIAVAPAGGGPSQLVIYAVLTDNAEIAELPLKKALQAAIREHQSSLFKLNALVITDALPRTASNKIMRRKLRADFQAKQETK